MSSEKKGVASLFAKLSLSKPRGGTWAPTAPLSRSVGPPHGAAAEGGTASHRDAAGRGEVLLTLAGALGCVLLPARTVHPSKC